MLETVKTVLLSMILLLFAWTDHRRQEVLLLPLIGAGIVGLIMHVWMQEQSVFGLLAGGAIGVFLLFYGRMTGESVGYGDGCLFIMTGIFLGFWRNLELLVIASLLAACYAGYLVVAKKKTKGERFPFVPFVWISSLFLWF